MMWLDPEHCSFEISDILRFTRKRYQRELGQNDLRDFAVIGCRLKGKSRFFDGEKEVIADPHHYILIPPHMDYQQSGFQEEIICIHLSIHALKTKGIMEFYSPSPDLREKFIVLHRCWETKEKGYRLKCDSLIYDILFELFGTTGSGANKKAQKLLSPALELIYGKFADPYFSASQAVAASHISPAYFRRLFKAQYGVAPQLFLNRLKIERAKVLLVGGSHPIKEIVALCGFTNEKYFFAVFKKITGSTPSEWSRLYG